MRLGTMTAPRLVKYFNCLFAIGIFLVSQPSMWIFWLQVGRLMGDFAFILLGITLVPGILRRFKLIFVFPSAYLLLVRLRRQIGIMVYLAVVAHILLVFILPSHTLVPTIISDWMGLVAFFILTPLFVTSNDFSMRLLKKTWRTIHSFVHVAVWFLLFHVLVKERALWSLVMGSIVIADVGSWIFYYHLVEHVISDIQKRAGKDRDEPENQKQNG